MLIWRVINVNKIYDRKRQQNKKTKIPGIETTFDNNVLLYKEPKRDRNDMQLYMYMYMDILILLSPLTIVSYFFWLTSYLVLFNSLAKKPVSVFMWRKNSLSLQKSVQSNFVNLFDEVKVRINLCFNHEKQCL